MKSIKKSTFIKLVLLALCLCAPSMVLAGSEKKPDFSILKGKWIRPDGGYVVEVGEIGPEGKVDVKYFNPKEINISEAEVSVQEGLLKLFIKLDDKGYPGSTYKLYYYREKDALAGYYYQAAIKQTFEVVFIRKKD